MPENLHKVFQDINGGKKITVREIHSLAFQLSKLRQKIASYGLWQTYHKMDEVLNKLGWESAEKLPGKRKKRV